jgi:hypothetical protein
MLENMALLVSKPLALRAWSWKTSLALPALNNVDMRLSLLLVQMSVRSSCAVVNVFTCASRADWYGCEAGYVLLWARWSLDVSKTLSIL